MEKDHSINAHSAQEQRYYGRRLCAALFATRPQDIISVRIDKGLISDFGPLLKWCAEQRKAYQLVEREQLDKLSKSTHHEGIILLAKRKLTLSEDQLWESLDAGKISGCVLMLDGVENPHNLGAVLRNCANFGVSAVITNDADLGSLSAASARVSEGASEQLDVFVTSALPAVLNKLQQKKFITVGTSSKGRANLYAHNFAKNVCIVMGSESRGISKDVLKAVDVTLKIPGTGAVHSLNVSAASAVLLSEYWRQNS